LGNYDKLRDYVRAKLEAVAADHPCSDVDINWNNIKSAIHEGINICIPKCKKNKRGRKRKLGDTLYQKQKKHLLISTGNTGCGIDL